MKVALVHDFLLYAGGAEKVLETLGGIYPDAPIYTLLQNRKFAREYFKDREVRTSFLQKAPAFLRKRHKFLLPLMPTAPETFNLRDFDLVISSSSAFAKGIIVKPKTTHVCYCHAPMRYVWDWSREYLEENRLRGRAKIFTRTFLNYLRMWDRASASRPDHFIANSRFTAARIKKYYGRESTVIYPPVEVERFQAKKEHQGYFLSLGRLSAYKKSELLIDVFSKLDLPLVIAGAGAEEEELRKLAKDKEKIQVLGWVDDKKRIELFENCRAFVCASEDDFAITCVEAMAAGKPVIALNRGGTAETVVAGKTGEFFENSQLELVADGVRRFIEKDKQQCYNHLEIRKRAEEFSRERFEREIKEFIAGLGLMNGE